VFWISTGSSIRPPMRAPCPSANVNVWRSSCRRRASSPSGLTARVERDVVRPRVGELGGQREIDARKVVACDGSRLGGRSRDHASRALARGTSLESRAGWAAVLRRAAGSWHADAGVEAHVTLLAARRAAPGGLLGLGPRAPLRVRIAEALEVLAAIANAERGRSRRGGRRGTPRRTRSTGDRLWQSELVRR